MTHQRQLLHLILVTSAVYKLKLIVCYMMIKMCRLTLQNYVPRIALSDYPSAYHQPMRVFQRRMFKILNAIEEAVCMMDDVLVLGKGSIDGWRWY